MHLTNGIYSNDELTILRPPIWNYGEYQDSAVMYINHENSLANTAHEHSDQSSFILYYKEKQLLIDPGYRPSWESYYIGKEWLTSPFAHNLIMVNPYDDHYTAMGDNFIEEEELNQDYRDLFDDVDENDDDDIIEWNDSNTDANIRDLNHVVFEYGSFEPIGSRRWFDDTEIFNPVRKNYLISNENISQLQIELDYDHPQVDYPEILRDDVINQQRNFYSFDLDSDYPYFIIYDELTSSDHTITNQFMNQLHFALEPDENNNEFSPLPDPINDPSLSEGKFTYKYYDGTVYLHGAMGNIGNAEYTIRDTLPQGLYHEDSVQPVWSSDFKPPQWVHKCMRTKVNTAGDEAYLTFLYPSESSDNPVVYAVNHDYGYGIKYDLEDSDDYIGYAAVYSGDTQFEFSQYNLQFATAADFFLVEADTFFIDFQKLILNGDNYIKARDQFQRFTEVVIYESDYDAEEVIAEWDNDALHVTHKTALNDRPRYKILRCEVEPENLYSKTEYGYQQTGSDRGTIEDNISYLSYDDDYFYVNYDYADLAAGNMLTEHLTIHKGMFNGITIQGIVRFGRGEIVLGNIIPVPYNAKIVFLPGSHPELAEDFHLTVDGNLTAEGTIDDPVIFDKYLTENWYEILIKASGIADFEYCEFTNAQFPLKSMGEVTVDNCEFYQNDRGIYLENPLRYMIENTYIHNCGYFGLLLKDGHTAMYHSKISNSRFDNNDYGLWFYNASPVTESDTLYSNKKAGIFAQRNSNPVITGTSISYTYFESTEYPEIRINSNSYPLIDKRDNDIIFDSGYSIYNQDDPGLAYNCRELWWGTTNRDDISQSFFPSSWTGSVNFTPFALVPLVGFCPFVVEDLFYEGLAYETTGDYEAATLSYQACIENDPTNLEAIWSLDRLSNCAVTEADLLDLIEYYDEIAEMYEDSKLAETAKVEKSFCLRLLSNHQTAIDEYEDLLDGELSFIDSVYTEIDIVYTYMEAATGNRAMSLTFKDQKHELTGIVQAKQREADLWELLDNETSDGGIYAPVISAIRLNKNYPNPFNPSTTISFSLPDAGMVELNIYNMKGQQVRTLMSQKFERGIHNVEWDGNDGSGKIVGSGVYLYELRVNGKSEAIKKCLMLK